MRLVIDPQHAATFARNVERIANRHRDGEYVAITPGPPGSGLVKIALHPLPGHADRGISLPAFGSFK